MFRTSAKQNISRNCKVTSVISKIRGIDPDVDSEMIKSSSDHMSAGTLELSIRECQCISKDSTVHVVLLRHHAIPSHVVFNVTHTGPIDVNPMAAIW